MTKLKKNCKSKIVKTAQVFNNLSVLSNYKDVFIIAVMHGPNLGKARGGEKNLPPDLLKDRQFSCFLLQLCNILFKF